jgi:hypothetical protein
MELFSEVLILLPAEMCSLNHRSVVKQLDPISAMIEHIPDSLSSFVLEGAKGIYFLRSCLGVFEVKHLRDLCNRASKSHHQLSGTTPAASSWYVDSSSPVASGRC